MAKNKKPRKPQKHTTSSTGKNSNVVQISRGRIERLHQADPMGASWRSYPRNSIRQSVIGKLKARPETEMRGDDWWKLGEYQIVEGLAEGDEAIINAGIQALMKGTNLSPPHAGCLLDMGWMLCYKGMDPMALLYLDQAVEAVPHSRDAWSLRGWACIGTGKREDAITSFEMATSLPGATEVDQSTLSALRDGADLDKLRKDLVLRKFDDEILRVKQGDPKEAARSGIIQFKQLLERKPGDLDLAYRLAYCHYVAGQLDHAEPLLLRVIGENPEHADALTLLGLISMTRGRAKEQRSYYERAVVAAPDHVLANINLAAMHQDDGDFHRARPMLSRAIEAAAADDPHLPIALDLLGNSYAAIEHNFEKEAELHRQAIALDPRRPLFHSNLIVALLSAGRAKEAQRAFQAAKDARLALPNQSLIQNLVRLYQDRTLHPYQYMQFVDQLAQTMSWPALKPLVRYAWERRNLVVASERVDFLGTLGMMASRTGDADLALEIWRYGCTIPGGEAFSANVAVELSNMDRHSEALEAAEKMSMDTPRSWTILGNIRLNAGQYKLALEAYRTALEKDERFLLPISNAISAAQKGLLAEDLEPFIERLRTDWQTSLKGASLLGQALLLQGKLTSSANSFQTALWDGDRIRTPEDLLADERDAADLSLLGEANLEDHYLAAKCLLELRRLNLLMQLISAVNRWPKWMNGDWQILEAEAWIAAGDLDRAEQIISNMLDQPPPQIVEAKIAIQREDLGRADQIIELGLQNKSAGAFNHPDGKPDAVFRTLAAERALAAGELELAEDHAREAIRRDPTCARARLALATVLDGRGTEEERLSHMRDGLRRSPGHPQLLGAFVTSLINAGDPESAANALEDARPLLIERGAADVAYRLGEAIAVDQLSRLASETASAASQGLTWPWIEQLQPPLRDWMRGANLSLIRGQDLAAAYVLYVSKIAEYLLVSKVMRPFRESMPDARSLTSERHRDVARFMAGGIPPSIGAIARLMEAASRSHRSSDEEMVVRFRDAISAGSFGNPGTLRSNAMISKLLDLGRARNSAAHLGDHDMAAFEPATKCVVAEGQPGPLLSALRAL